MIRGTSITRAHAREQFSDDPAPSQTLAAPDSQQGAASTPITWLEWAAVLALQAPWIAFALHLNT